MFHVGGLLSCHICHAKISLFMPERRRMRANMGFTKHKATKGCCMCGHTLAMPK